MALIWAHTRWAGKLVARALPLVLVVLGVGPVAVAAAQAPAITIDSPLNGTATNKTYPVFSGSTDDPLDEVTLSIYEGASVGGTLIQTPQKTFPSLGQWSLEAQALPDGTYTAQATQTNLLAETGASEPVTLTIDTMRPAVTLNAAIPLSSDTTPSFSGAAGVAFGDSSVVKLNVYAGAVASGAPTETIETLSSGATWTSGPVGALQDGVYTAQAEQLDQASNRGLSAPSTFKVDTMAPAITLSAPANGSSLNTASPNLKGQAGTAEGDVAHITIELFSGSSVEAQNLLETIGVSASAGHWSASFGGLADGTYTALARQSDEAGNTANSSPVTFTVDTVAPAVSLEALPKTIATATPTFSGNAGTASDDVPAVTLKIYAGTHSSGVPVQTFHVTPSGGSWTAGPVAALPDGTYTAQAKQLDKVGNVGESNDVTFVVQLLAPPVVPEPVPEPVAAPPAGAPPTAAAAAPPLASFTWVPSAPNVGETVTLVSGSTDMGSPITGFAWALSGNAFVVSGPVLTTSFSTPGDHAVQLRVNAADGLSSTVVETIPVKAPSAPLMQPFPIVRIAGADTAKGAKLTLLSVQAPSGARIAVSCKGVGCPRPESRLAGSSSVGVVLVEFRRFERTLRAGVILEVRVSKNGEIGKFTRFRIRRKKLPVRTDGCLSPTTAKPVACPS